VVLAVAIFVQVVVELVVIGHLLLENLQVVVQLLNQHYQ
jgi:hypothetical protein